MPPLADIVAKIQAIVIEHAETWRQHREHLHANPELTGHEFETTQWLADQCRRLGGQPVLTNVHRGVWCDVGGDKHSQRVLVRGDIDALPIQTSSTRDYRSRVDGIMHACGHDVHATCVLAAMQIVTELGHDRDPAMAEFTRQAAVRFCFQPAEEDSTGGPLMVASGATASCTSAIALHCEPGRPAGQVGVRWGSFTASCDVFTAAFHGRGGHGARPHLTDDSLTAAIAFVSDVYRRIPRCTDSRHPVVVNVGSLHSGTASNVVPIDAVMTGTLRSTTIEGRDVAASAMRQIGQGIAQSHGCEFQLNFGVSNPPVVNHPDVSDAIHLAATSLLGESSVETMRLPSMGAEDFAFIAAEVPGAMFRLGIAGPKPSDGDPVGTAPLHTPNFDVDPRCLQIGATVLALAALKLHHHPPTQSSAGHTT